MTEPTEEQRAELNEIHKQFHDRFKKTYLNVFRKRAPKDAPATTRVCICAAGALMNLAGAIAIDLGIPLERFIGMAGESYNRAHSNAPKWG